ncbi:MAG: hypothetical protein AAGG44_21465, partial [Planctomycetota bacterium]
MSGQPHRSESAHLPNQESSNKVAAKDPIVMDRRAFVQTAGAASAASAAGLAVTASATATAATTAATTRIVDNFDRQDSIFHGEQWESLNPGYWKIKNGALRRRVFNVGDRARSTGFPFHYA